MAKRRREKLGGIRIIHEAEPEIITTEPHNFRHLVHTLTGKPTTNPLPLPSTRTSSSAAITTCSGTKGMESQNKSAPHNNLAPQYSVKHEIKSDPHFLVSLYSNDNPLMSVGQGQGQSSSQHSESMMFNPHSNYNPLMPIGQDQGQSSIQHSEDHNSTQLGESMMLVPGSNDNPLTSPTVSNIGQLSTQHSKSMMLDPDSNENPLTSVVGNNPGQGQDRSATQRSESKILEELLNSNIAYPEDAALVDIEWLWS